MAISVAGSSPRVRGTANRRRCVGKNRRFIPAGAGNRRHGSDRPVPPAVHPRGCGEQRCLVTQGWRQDGSSPRVRRTDLHGKVAPTQHRFIPAGAGNSAGRIVSILDGPVHPRGCGEQGDDTAVTVSATGSSPRVRGTGGKALDLIRGKRFIPAGAGNSAPPCRRSRPRSVHPRGCGEQYVMEFTVIDRAGSSPRVRGTGPGNPRAQQARRFIPAGAGNRADRDAVIRRNPVHPRGCGEQSPRRLNEIPGGGSSPRVRGTGRRCRRGGSSHRFIPAGAGNSQETGLAVTARSVHPRGCGEQSATNADLALTDGSSPRVRGTGRWFASGGGHERFIPAGAGNRFPASRRKQMPAVHPRGCGEQVGFASADVREAGSSPRVRGTAGKARSCRSMIRFIPAGAGNRCAPVGTLTSGAVHPRGCGEQLVDCQ